MKIFTEELNKIERNCVILQDLPVFRVDAKISKIIIIPRICTSRYSHVNLRAMGPTWVSSI